MLVQIKLMKVAMIKEVMHWTKKQLSIYLIRTTLPMKHLCHHVLLEYESLKVVLDDAKSNGFVLMNVLLQKNVQVDAQVDAMHTIRFFAIVVLIF